MPGASVGPATVPSHARRRTGSLSTPSTTARAPASRPATVSVICASCATEFCAWSCSLPRKVARDSLLLDGCGRGLGGLRDQRDRGDAVRREGAVFRAPLVVARQEAADERDRAHDGLAAAAL